MTTYKSRPNLSSINTRKSHHNLYPSIDLHDKLLTTQDNNIQLKLQLNELHTTNKLNQVKIAKLSKLQNGESIMYDIDEIKSQLMAEYNNTGSRINSSTTSTRTQSISNKSIRNKSIHKKSINHNKLPNRAISSTSRIHIEQPNDHTNNENINRDNTAQHQSASHTTHHNTAQQQVDPSHIQLQSYNEPLNQAVANTPDLVQLKLELRDKHTQILLLQQQYNTLQQQYRNEREITQQSKNLCAQLTSEIESKNESLKIMNHNMNLLHDTQYQIELLNNIISDVKSDNTLLKHQNDLLTKSMYECDNAESNKLQAVHAQYQNELNTLKQQVVNKDNKINEFRSTLQSSIDNLKLQQIQLNELQEGKQQTDAQLVRLHQQLELANEKLSLFTVDNGIELAELESALTFIRRNKHNTAKPNAIQQDELELINKQLRVELNSVRSQLATQLQLNQQQKQSIDQHKSKLLSSQQRSSQLSPSDQHNDVLDESMFDMSEAGDMNELSTIIAIHCSTTQFHQSHYVYSTYQTTEPITFITIDFYDYQSSISKLQSGYQPNYNMLAQYPVTLDPILLHYLETNYITISLYTITEDMTHTKIGTGQISLKPLLTPSGTDRNSIKLYCTNHNDTNDCVAEFNYLLKIQRPILSIPPTPTVQTPRIQQNRPQCIDVQNVTDLHSNRSVKPPDTAPFHIEEI